MSTSGVGTQARWLINGLVATGKYSFRCFGGAIKHDNYDTITVNPDFIIKPTNGFGDRNLLRKALSQIKPDAIMLFTDPRFFYWVWEMEDEIHQVCPITYWHLWDNPPWPDFNRVLYESTDLINCINYPTFEMVHKRFPEKTNYIPHAVPNDLYHPLPEEQVLQFRKKMLGASADHFVALYVSRNARRKMTGDTLVSWKMFLDDLQEKHGHKKAKIIMHTDPLDQEGANLHHVIDMLGIKDNVVFSNDRIGFQDMSLLYNMCDVTVLRSCNEGFGLSILESKMCGKPVIAMKTGGMTRQVEDHETGEQFGVALEPEVKSLVGNQLVPYIYEDFVSHKTVSDAFMKMYELGGEGRKTLGLRGREHALKNYDMLSVVKNWDDTLMKCIESWRENRKPWEHIEI